MVSTAWADSWPEYITELKLVGGTESEVTKLTNTLESEGWIRIDQDLNEGAGGDYIYLFYKKDDRKDPNGGYITDLDISTTNTTSYTSNNATYYRVDYDGGSYFKQNNGNLNSKAKDGCTNMWLYYTKKNFSDKRAVNKIYFYSGKSNPGSKGAVGGIDLNQYAGGTYIYMYLDTLTKHNRPKSDPVMASGLAYNGSPRRLVETNATLWNGTMYYRFGSSTGSNITDIKSIKATAPGTYTVYYFAGPTDYAVSSTLHSQTVTIAKSSNKNVNVGIGSAYTVGESFYPYITGTNLSTGSVTYQYSTSKNGSYSTTKPASSGTYWVRAVINGDNNCYAYTTPAVSFQINPPIKDLVIAAIPEQTYSGSPICPDVSVQNGNRTLRKGSDYTTSCANNINVGDANITISGIGDYSGSITKSFKIVQKSVTGVAVDYNKSLEYTGSAICPEVVLMDGERMLVQNKDYSVACMNNIEIGTDAVITVNGMGNYTGSISNIFEITRKSIESAELVYNEHPIYTGYALCPEVVVKDGEKTLVENTDYTYKCTAAFNVGSQGSIKITGMGKYKGQVDGPVTPLPKLISSEDITFTGYWRYDDVNDRHKITSVAVCQGKAHYLSSETDYTTSITYDERGFEFAIIEGKGNYTGSTEIKPMIVSGSHGLVTIPKETLVLFENATINGPVTCEGYATILLVGENHVISNDYGINAYGSLKFYGSGSLAISAKTAISCNGDIELLGGKIEADGSERGIYAKYCIDFDWNNVSDYIKASNYDCDDFMFISNGKKIKDEKGRWYSSSISNKKFDDIAGLKLSPYITFSLTFVTGDKNVTISSRNIERGDTPVKPADPVRSGFKFLGWYADENLTESFDWNKPFMANATAYAAWEANQPVNYIDENGDNQTFTDYIDVTEMTTFNKEGWYVVRGTVAIKEGTIYTDKDIKLILADDSELKISGEELEGFYAKSLAVYGQSRQTGTLSVTSYRNGLRGGNITIAGGVVQVKSRNAVYCSSGEVRIIRGNVNAIATETGISANELKIEGGSVNVEGKVGFSAGVSISGGNVKVVGSSEGIYSRKTIAISGGLVDVEGSIETTKGLFLDWSDASSYIKASGYDCGSVTIAQGKKFKDENGNRYSGELSPTDIKAIAGQKLVPFEGRYISFVTGVENVSVESQEVELGQVPTSKPIPTRKDYVLAGWFIDEKLLTEFDWTRPVTEDVVVYAKWKENDPVSYIDADGNSQQVKEYTLLTNSANMENLPGGWYVVQGDLSYSSRINSEENLYIVLADGANIDVDGGNKEAIKAKNVYIYGQEQQTGKLAVSGSKGIEADSISIYGGTVTATGRDAGLYATFYITIIGGNVEANAGDAGIRAYFDITLGWRSMTNSIKSSGYIFPRGELYIVEDQFFITEDGIVVRGFYENSSQVSDWANKTLVPMASKILTYETGVDGIDMQPQKVPVGEAPIKPAHPARLGYGFRGWFADENFKNEFDWTKPFKEDATIYAKWEKLAPVAYVDGDGKTQLLEEYHELTSEIDVKTLPEGWYVVQGNVSVPRIQLNRTYNVVLADGANLTVSKGFLGKKINIYGQSEQTGSLTTGHLATSDLSSINGANVICNDKNGTSVFSQGTVIIRNGYVKVTNGGFFSGTVNLEILGGRVDVDGVVGQANAKTIVLGWINENDYIRVKAYEKNNGVFKVADGQTLMSEDGKFYSGELTGEQIEELAGKTLRPAVQPIVIMADAEGKNHAYINGAYNGLEPANIEKDTEVETVAFERDFPIGKYSTTVLPFGVNTENVEGLDAVLRYNGIKTVSGVSSIRMKVVWATDEWVKRNDLRDKNNNLIQYDHADLTANTPYLVQMNDATLKLKSEAFPLMLEKTAPADVSIDGWTFRGTWEYKKWGPSCSTEGQNCDRETGNAYGFAASSSDDDKINVGDFVRVGEGAWIRPMRAYLVSTKILESTSPVQGVRANGAYVKRPSFAQEDLPEFMSIVIDVDDEGKETTVIGQFNTRTGEIRMNRVATDRVFDLKGRRVNGRNNARGAYYGKKVLKK